MAQDKRSTKVCGSHTHTGFQRTPTKKDGTQHKRIQKDCSHEKTTGCERQVEDKNATVHTPLDPFLESQYFVTRPATAPKQKLCNKAKQAPKRYRATSSPQELINARTPLALQALETSGKRKLDRSAGSPAAMTMTTLIEDGSNMCWASGPAGMGDGVMTPRKASETWIGVERSWLREGSGNAERRQYVEICAHVTSEKSGCCDKFGSAEECGSHTHKVLQNTDKKGWRAQHKGILWNWCHEKPQCESDKLKTRTQPFTRTLGCSELCLLRYHKLFFKRRDMGSRIRDKIPGCWCTGASSSSTFD